MTLSCFFLGLKHRNDNQKFENSLTSAFSSTGSPSWIHGLDIRCTLRLHDATGHLALFNEHSSQRTWPHGIMIRISDESVKISGQVWQCQVKMPPNWFSKAPPSCSSSENSIVLSGSLLLQYLKIKVINKVRSGWNPLNFLQTSILPTQNTLEILQMLHLFQSTPKTYLKTACR